MAQNILVNFAVVFLYQHSPGSYIIVNSPCLQSSRWCQPESQDSKVFVQGIAYYFHRISATRADQGFEIRGGANGLGTLKGGLTRTRCTSCIYIPKGVIPGAHQMCVGGNVLEIRRNILRKIALCTIQLCRIPGHATQAKAGLSGTRAEADRPKPRCTWQIKPFHYTYFPISKINCGWGGSSAIVGWGCCILPLSLWSEWGCNKDNEISQHPLLGG